MVTAALSVLAAQSFFMPEISMAADETASSVAKDSVSAGSVSWDVSMYGFGATESTLPFWAVTNRHGIIPDTHGGLLLGRADLKYAVKPALDIYSGLSLAGSYTGSGMAGMVDELYFGIGWKNLRLDIGMKDRSQDLFHGLSLTGGDMIMTGNSRNFPGYNLSTSFINVPGTKGIFAFKANFADYRMIDDRYAQGAMLHNQALSFKFAVHRRVDIILALDVSTSMLARDFTPDRINAAKEIAIQFVAERPTDRIGVVVFAGESYTQSPLTTDRATLINLVKEIECGLIDDGTAIGNGLTTAVARLKDSQAKSRVVILLTDGVNNAGEISPQMAVEIAKTYGIRVYTIGVGAMGTAPYPVMTPFGVELQQMKVEIDEQLLQNIAEETGGEYFRATDNSKLLEIYGEINKMEKSKTMVDSFPIYKELFMRFALVALGAILLEMLLRFFVIKQLPD